jgi:hypothetical protein
MRSFGSKITGAARTFGSKVTQGRMLGSKGSMTIKKIQSMDQEEKEIKSNLEKYKSKSKNE